VNELFGCPSANAYNSSIRIEDGVAATPADT
jgi:hypothetical protein